MEVMLKIKEVDSETGEIVTTGEKTIYPADGQVNDWAEAILLEDPGQDGLRLSSAVRARTEMEPRRIRSDSLGMMLSKGNNVYENSTGVALFTSAYSDSGSRCVQIASINFNRVVAFFFARKAIFPDWLNDKDEYLVPDTEHPDYEQWVNDAIVYALFNNSSQQSALRGIEYKDKLWNIRNQFFFISNKDMRELANQINFTQLVRDAEQFPEDAYVFNQLKSVPLSADATQLVGAAYQLIRDSMRLRKRWHEDPPSDLKDLHLQAWDAGWAQLKPLFKKCFEPEYKEFVAQYKEFEDRMREGVYKFGFLRE